MLSAGSLQKERIIERWEEQQEASLDGEDDLGARSVYEEFTEKVFDAAGQRSRPAVVAQMFARSCPAVVSFKLFHTALKIRGRRPMAAACFSNYDEKL